MTDPSNDEVLTRHATAIEAESWTGEYPLATETMPMPDSTSVKNIVLYSSGLALIVAVVRFFLKNWLEPLGVPVVVGSMLASVTIVLLIGMVMIFLRHGRGAGGSYMRAAGWFLLLAIWCEILVISGILVTERTGAKTYYQGPWHPVEEAFPNATAHALGHAQGFLVRAFIGLLLGAGVYAVAKRLRSRAAAHEPG